MTTIAIGKKIPNFSLPATSEQTLSPSTFKGKQLVLYFYPKDNTPGCTTEGIDFAKAYPAFQKQNTEIIGVSRDSLTSHEKFKCNFEFPFELLSDHEETLCELFDVLKLKTNFGKQYKGIERSTFLIDKQGVVREIWRKVRVAGHVDEVLAAATQLNKE